MGSCPDTDIDPHRIKDSTFSKLIAQIQSGKWSRDD